MDSSTAQDGDFAASRQQLCVPQEAPGTVTLHRLNRLEFENSVRDLFGVGGHPAADFPPDPGANGFDNNADALSMNYDLLDQVQKAAERIVTEALQGANHTALTSCSDPSTDAAICARESLGRLAPRVWRRPVTPEELDELVALAGVAFAQGDALEQGLQLAWQAMIVSPNFLFRPELDPDPASPAPHPLTDYELASRLSYFLYSSVPDDELIAAATAGSLRTGIELERQTRRMLTDPKAASFVENFSEQWLGLRNLKDHAPSLDSASSFNESIRDNMRRETLDFFGSFVAGGNSLDLLTADYTFVSPSLATYYGLASPPSADSRRISIADTPRRGLLGHGSILTVTSASDRTSPVRRGQWVLSRLLCSPPPPPPPEAQAQFDQVDQTASKREQMRQHRAKPECVGCHRSMDPIGFGLENFDEFGTYRTTERGAPVDATGELPDGTTFDGAAQLATVLRADPRFPDCLSRNVFVYALGRETVDTDTCRLEGFKKDFGNYGYELKDLITTIVLSDAFRHRQGGT